MSIAIVVDTAGLDKLNALTSRLDTAQTEELLTDIGGLLESSTRERISETKTSPDGAAWPPNRAGTSILLQSGRHLLDSIAFIVGGDQVEVGSSWEYAHVHQDGATITPKTAQRLAFKVGGRTVFARKVTIPARPFVGFSAEDREKVERLATDWLGRLVGGAAGGGAP
ncbi:phage virion morphogenesis protein [Rhodoplanes sp. TEM]|uniref:Phage virion morphogenesis protein n=1 Tax=Rhodoplanes tepidamans TaxID=200616 RepID=A0ABT5JCE1_RHOTP|nr:MULTISPECIES: phage virion morphogenesis protein [Rhodoplanes]MDC7787360.1 phage virion morphogenesis protein [Rhodoplanes tepidamans]MDC7984758.1 phage virion morphogenesis protein [Rhodoplanes sp. TEM]MDQ0358271.1 phage virion morphogenesis protein [Rhodoplanes tepidamans]